MKLIDEVHTAYVHQRRIRVLCDHLLRVLPNKGTVLDVGCGDGILAKSIVSRNPALLINGIDILVRKNTAVPVYEFDGAIIPFPDASFDAIMFTDVLHHTVDPMVLLREAVRVSKRWIILKDHTCDGWFAEPILRFMDRVGNCRHNVVLPHNYWPRTVWFSAFNQLGLRIDTWVSNVRLYPLFANWIFGRSLHFIARLEKGEVLDSSDVPTQYSGKLSPNL